ncbi:MAG: hypothetical protein SCARUB_01594 [Candidatus Scalindua rubra]|uniref:Uncharacterized protein n=1 Tax=Candidatus Scalindua rubra TaxID=1872076 RepID=A0A1E3XCE2_9BACT|nr:MAG: hypothetical protein SCARUB_01594 [Candidatus Scalindua rubra]
MSRRTLNISFLYVLVVMVGVAFVTNNVLAKPLKELTLTGENYCIGCSLKKAEGAAAQCSIYGCKHVLKVEKAVDSTGNEISELKGLTLHYLENDASVELFKGKEYHGKVVSIKGNVHLDERVVDVTSVTPVSTE